MTFINRLDNLLKTKKLTRKEFLEQMKFGKNQITYWEKKQTLPNPSTLSKIATFFGVSVEYLTGIEDEEKYASRVMNLVVEWLEDNGYDYSEDEYDIVVISKDNMCVKYAKCDFATVCKSIKTSSETDAFNLAMIDWERRSFRNCTNDDLAERDLTAVVENHNTAEMDKSLYLSKQEKAIISVFRAATEEKRLRMIAAIINIKDKI